MWEAYNQDLDTAFSNQLWQHVKVSFDDLSVENFLNFVQTISSSVQYLKLTSHMEDIRILHDSQLELAAFSNLKSLDCSGTQFADAAFLKYMPNLESLYMRGVWFTETDLSEYFFEDT